MKSEGTQAGRVQREGQVKVVATRQVLSTRQVVHRKRRGQAGSRQCMVVRRRQ